MQWFTDPFTQMRVIGQIVVRKRMDQSPEARGAKGRLHMVQRLSQKMHLKLRDRMGPAFPSVSRPTNKMAGLASNASRNRSAALLCSVEK